MKELKDEVYNVTLYQSEIDALNKAIEYIRSLDVSPENDFVEMFPWSDLPDKI